MTSRFGKFIRDKACPPVIVESDKKSILDN